MIVRQYSCKSRPEKNVVVVSVKGKIDAVTAPDFEKALANLIAQVFSVSISRNRIFIIYL